MNENEKKILEKYGINCELLTADMTKKFFNDMRQMEKQKTLKEIKKMQHMGFAAWIERMEYYYAECNGIMLIGRCAGVSFEDFAKTLIDVNRKLNDDWSLKGKEHFGYDALRRKLIALGSTEHMCVFYQHMIETLRKKLIEDLERAWKHVEQQKDKTFREYWFMTEWKASIDKRFGVTPKQKDSMNTME